MNGCSIHQPPPFKASERTPLIGRGQWLFLGVLIFMVLACGVFYDDGGAEVEASPAPPVQQSAPGASSTVAQAGGEAPAAAYYVATNGADENPGTLAKPWRTLKKAAQSVSAGDTVYLRGGDYNEQLILENSGSAAGGYITFTAYSGETVTLDGQGLSIAERGGLVEVEDLSYIRISGLHLVNSGGAGLLADHCDNLVVEKNTTNNTVSSGIGMWNCRQVTIDGNEVVLANNDGEQENITVAVTDGFVVRNNHIHDGGPGGNGGEGIDIKDGSCNGEVYDNHVHDIQRAGIYVDAWDKHTCNIKIYNNLVHDVGADAFMISSEMGGLLENVWVTNNIAYHNKWIGVDISDCCSASHPMRNIYIINNTLYSNGWESWGGGIVLSNLQAENVVMRNNIVSQNLYFQIAVDPKVPVGSYAIDYNLVDGYNATEGETLGDSPVTGDPRFINAVGNDFHLGADSPAIDAGSAKDAPSSDYAGSPRPYDGNVDGTAAYDIGAYEYGSAVAPTPTPSPTVFIYLPLVLRRS